MKKKSKKASVTGSVGTLLLGVGLLLSVRWIFVEPYVIPSGSMIPTLLINDHILVSKISYGIRWPFSSKWIFKTSLPERGDIVVFRSVETPDIFMIKRVVGLPGDKISLAEDGQLTINGKSLERDKFSAANDPLLRNFSAKDFTTSSDSLEFYKEENENLAYTIIQQVSRDRWPVEEMIVPDDALFVMGDNRDNSRDSRYWGSMPLDNLLGKALFVWLSCRDTVSGAPFLCHPQSIRWNRFFHSVN